MSSRPDSDDLPGVAGATGRYREWAAPAPVQGCFGQLWRSDLPVGHSGEVAVLPDGCVDILWREGRLYAVGPDVVAAHPQLMPGAQVLGARFQPGAARAWLGVPLDELVGTAVELDAVLGPQARQLAARLNDVGDGDARQRLFAQALAGLPRSTGSRHAVAARVFGQVRAGYLEGSNVDLSREFSDLVIMQRGYQASSQVISTATERFAPPGCSLAIGLPAQAAAAIQVTMVSP